MWSTKTKRKNRDEKPCETWLFLEEKVKRINQKKKN